MLFSIGCCSFRWVCLYLMPSLVGFFVFDTFSGWPLFFLLSLFVSDIFFSRLLFFLMGLLVSGVFSDR